MFIPNTGLNESLKQISIYARLRVYVMQSTVALLARLETNCRRFAFLNRIRPNRVYRMYTMNVLSVPPKIKMYTFAHIFQRMKKCLNENGV